MKQRNSDHKSIRGRRPSVARTTGDGFTLVEFLIAMAVFMTISGAAFMLFDKQQTTFLRQQSLSGINIALRNATAQMQMDVSNSGTAYFQGVNIPAWPVGVTIVNHVVAANTSCYNAGAFTYTANCFDVLNIIEGANPTLTPPINVTNNTGAPGAGFCSLTNTGTAYGRAAVPPPPTPPLTLAQTAANFKAGDQLLFLSQSGQRMTSVVLTADAASTATAVVFSFNSTNADGTNTLANDPLDITACDGNPCPSNGVPAIPPCPGCGQPPPAPFKFQNQFCGNDWIIKLAPITYQVDSSNPANPRLTRTAPGSPPATVMDQVIGFKVGATIWNSAANTVSTLYNYDASTYSNSVPGDQGWNFNLVRSVRISLIGRTTPNTNPTYTFRNAFDNGPYQVEGIGLVVNPRNMSMND